MSENTTNYQLTKLGNEDFATIVDINGNVDKIDLALKQNNDAQQIHNTNKNNPHDVTKVQIGLGNVDNTADYDKPVSAAQQELLNGKADLGADGTVPIAQLPSSIDAVVEYNNKANFPVTGVNRRIYIATNTNLIYRWNGVAYIEISPPLALGETSDTAYRGDKGKQNALEIESTKASLTSILNLLAARNKVLWEGTWIAGDIGTITVPNWDKYSIFLVKNSDLSTGVMVREGNRITGLSGYSYNNNTIIMSANFTVNGNEWKKDHDIVKSVHTSGGSHAAKNTSIAITKIVGLEPIPDRFI